MEFKGTDEFIHGRFIAGEYPGFVKGGALPQAVGAKALLGVCFQVSGTAQAERRMIVGNGSKAVAA